MASANRPQNLKAHKAIVAARSHLGVGLASSAKLCLDDAVSLYDKRDFDAALKRARRSLAYSVGIFHADYKRFND